MTENIKNTYSYKASGTILKNRLVKMTTANDTVTYATAGDGKVIGVSNDGVTTGQDLEVVTDGIVEVYTTEAVTRGDYAMAAANGQASVASHATAEATEIVGIFEETTSDAGLAFLNLKHNGLYRTV